MIRFLVLFCIFIFLSNSAQAKSHLTQVDDKVFREAIKHFVPLKTFHIYKGKKIKLSSLMNSVSKYYPEILIAQKEISIAHNEIISSMGSFDFKWNSYGTSNPLGYYVNDRVNTVIEKPTPYQGVSVFAGYRIGNGNFPSYEGKHFTTPGGEVRAGVKLPLWRGREIDEARVKLNKAKIGKGKAYTIYDSEKLRIYKTSIQKYWEWVAAGRQYIIIKNLLNLAKKRVKQLEAIFEAGDIPLIEKKENDRAILEREVYLIEAERYLQKTSLSLSLYFRNKEGKMYLPVPSQIPNDFSDVKKITSKNLEKDVEIAWKKRPEMLAIEMEKRKVYLDLELQKNHLTPQVDLVVVGAQNIGSKRSELDKYIDTEIAKLTATSTDNQQLLDRLLKPQMEVSVVLSIPIQTRKQRGKIGSLIGKLSQLNKKNELLKDKIRIEVQDAFSEYENARKEVIIAKKEADLARKLEKMEREKFTLGSSNLLIVNIREQKTAEASAKYIKSLAMRNIAYSYYLAATGELLDLKKLLSL